MVRDDHDFVPVPNLGGFSEMVFEDADRARTAYVMRHQHIHINPDIVTGLDRGAARMLCENFLYKTNPI